MSSWPLSDDTLRAMYRGGHAGPAARRFARAWAAVFALGLLPKRWVTLEVTGRRSGRTTRFPLGMADWNRQWYLVPMLGEHCNWVQNVRAAGGSFGVAGQLGIGELRRVDADIVGVRSAVCPGGDRGGALDAGLVAAAVAEVRRAADSPGGRPALA